MAIVVGINPSVKINTPSINDQYGSLDIVVARREAEVPVEPVDEFATFLAGGSTKTTTSQYAEEQRISRYPLSTEGYKDRVLQALEGEDIANNMALLLADLRHILVQGKLAAQYNQVAQKDKKQFLRDMFVFSGTLAAYKEVGIVDMVTRNEKLKDQAVLDVLSRAIFTEFIQKFEEQEVAKAPLRVLLVRTSKAKHYPTMRQAKFEDGPINSPTFEREDLVPEDKSRLSFTKWEKENGYDSGDKLQPDATTTSADINDLFGSPVEASPFN